jgi:hypothetical protein
MITGRDFDHSYAHDAPVIVAPPPPRVEVIGVAPAAAGGSSLDIGGAAKLVKRVDSRLDDRCAVHDR